MCSFDSMDSPQYSSQQSTDLDIYFPKSMTLEDTEGFLSADQLLEVFNFDLITSAHRFDMDIFDPKIDDKEALSSLIDVQNIPNNPQSPDVCHYFREKSQVIPHISKEPIPVEEQHHPSINLKKFLVFDSRTGRERRPLLHEFLRILLEFDEYSHMVEYLDRKRGIFILHKPKAISELWKIVKGRNSNNKMTYDKLARAIRYYYPSGIMASTPGQFTFRFGPKSGFGTTWFPSY